MKRVKRMTATMRTIHWVNFFSMIVAIVTGFYIAEPYYQSLIAEGAVDKYVMAWNKWGHFMVAIIFDVTSIVVVYLYFFSRFEKPYKKVLPTPTNIKEFFAVLINLLTLNRKKDFDSTHADSFNTVYFTIFHLLLAWMLLTGLSTICAWGLEEWKRSKYLGALGGPLGLLALWATRTGTNSLIQGWVWD